MGLAGARPLGLGDRVVLIPPGPAGTRHTLAQMRFIAWQSSLDPLVRQVAADTIDGAGARDYDEQVRCIRRFLATHVKFTRDPVGAEMVQYPAELLQQMRHGSGLITGDCDCVATLAAALGCAVGLKARFVAVGFPMPGVVDANVPLKHVFTQLLGRSGWLEMDVTRPQAGEPITIARREIVNV